MRVSLLGVVSCALLALSAPFASANYACIDTYDSTNWLSSFDFWTASDPTHGFVQFVSSDEAQTRGMLVFDDHTRQVYMGVDWNTQGASSGRKSIRIQSKQQFTQGLFILDVDHIPEAVCGSWPAFWSVGPNWPAGGEIDVIEGVNTQQTNFMTLHTSGGCTINENGVKGGTQLMNGDCNNGGASNGCSEHSSDSATFGDGFNNGGGGVYAYEWTNDHISIWNFPRNGIPGDISAGKPNPDSWGAPVGRFAGCDFQAHFYQHRLVFDNTFCGDWAGNTFGQDGNCRGRASSCNDFVANNPGAFQNVYWKINSLKVYQQQGAQQQQQQQKQKVLIAEA